MQIPDSLSIEGARYAPVVQRHGPYLLDRSIPQTHHRSPTNNTTGECSLPQVQHVNFDGLDARHDGPHASILLGYMLCAPQLCCMHANSMLVNRHHGGSYPASDLTWCISHDAIATRALATMPSSHPAASPRFHADSHVRRDCRQACRPDVHTSLSLTDRKQVQLQLSACHHAYSRVNLMNHARAVWTVPHGEVQRSRSAPLHYYWRAHVWVLNITPYVPRHKHQTTNPLSLPYMQLAEIVHAR
jgi:hypothetical protein